MFTKADIEKYFIAEKNESILFMLAGVVAIGVGLFFLIYYKSSFARGMAIPLLAIAAIHFVIGFTVFRRSDEQRTTQVYSYDMDPHALMTNEVPRMNGVMKNFVVLRWVEIGLAVSGLLLILFFRRNEAQQLWYGAGFGLFLQAMLSLVLDFFAEKRGHEYLDGLKSFLKM
ncbi:MAG: hypothetical protein ACKVOR_04475 [Flavobacteriales bacterium]